MNEIELRAMRYQAGRWDAFMVLLAVIAGVLGLFAWLTMGWVSGVILVVLSGVAYGLSKVFAIATVMLGALGRLLERSEGERPRLEATGGSGNPAR